MNKEIFRRRLKQSLILITLAWTLGLAGCRKEKQNDAAETLADLQEQTFVLYVYQYGTYIETDIARISMWEFKLYHNDELIRTYPYLKMSSSLIALYEEEQQSYVVCSYELSEDQTSMTIDILGATTTDMTGEWNAAYEDFGSVAKLELTTEGIGREYEQYDISGRAVGEETSFFYCFRGGDGARKLLILSDDRYYSYAVGVDKETKSLSLTIEGETSYIRPETPPTSVN